MSRTRRLTVAVLAAIGMCVLPVPGQSLGTGRLTLDGRTYEFDVTICTLHSGDDLSARMVAGRGVGPNDELVLSVDIMAIEESDGTQQATTVHLQGPRLYLAHYRETGVGWVDERGPVEGPLIEVHEETVIVKGVFVETNGGGVRSVPGTIEITCSH